IWPPSEFLIHTLLSLGVPSIAIWPSWPASVSHSLGVVHIRNFSVFLSNFAMALWYITPTQGLSSRSNSRSSVPSDHPGLTTGIGYCVTLPVFGSILPRNIWPKSEYQTLRLRRRAAGIVTGHALENLHEAVGVVRRLHDALERVAAVAVEEEALLLVRARHAHHPFGIGQVRGKIFHFLELDVGARHTACGDVR